MLEQIILGIIQGIAEWLPVSSEGLIVLVKANFFKGSENLEILIKNALALHFGTLMAAVVYFRQDVKILAKTLFNYKEADAETQKLFTFLIIATVISGTIGIILIKSLSHLIVNFGESTKFINFIIGCCLLVTAYLELRTKHHGYREIRRLRISDGILLGITQGFAALPGLSRSGLTVSALLLRKFNKIDSLKLSFLMSIPIVLAGNIVYNIEHLMITPEIVVGMLFAFIFGLATIHLLLKMAQKINFGYFVLVFALLMIISTFI